MTSRTFQKIMYAVMVLTVAIVVQVAVAAVSRTPKSRLPKPYFEGEIKPGVNLTLYHGRAVDQIGLQEGLSWTSSSGDSCQSRMSCTMSSYKTCGFGGSTTVAIIEDRDEGSITCLVKCNRFDDPDVTKCWEVCDPCVATSWNCQGPCLEPEPTPQPCPNPELCGVTSE